MGAIVASDISVRYEDYVSSIILVNPTSEGELPEERLFRRYAHTIKTGMMKSKTSF